MEDIKWKLKFYNKWNLFERLETVRTPGRWGWYYVCIKVHDDIDDIFIKVIIINDIYLRLL